MPRHKKNESAVVTRPLIRQFVDRYDKKSKQYIELKSTYDAEKRHLHDFRNEVIEETSLLLVPVEWALKKVREKGSNWCVTWLHAVVLTFAEMGVFDQADLFLVDELVQEISKTKSVAA